LKNRDLNYRRYNNRNWKQKIFWKNLSKNKPEMIVEV